MVARRTAARAHDVPVLIAGAGPVGLTLAADLAWRGIGSLVVDPRVEVDAHPRAISIGVRSMEHFRRLGLDQAVVDVGVPRDHPLDVVYVTRMLGTELFRFPIPSIDDLERRADALARDIPEIAASPYYKTWVAQSPLERVLRRHLQTNGRSELRTGWRLDSFTQDDEFVSARLVENDTGRSRMVSADYLIGCDGGGSVVRAGLGIRLAGRGALGAARGFYFRAPGLRALLPGRAGVMYWPMAPGCAGVIYTIGDGDDWLYNRYYAAGETPSNESAESQIQAALGRPLDVEIVSVQDWTPRQLVADSFGRGRVFLAGDACHLFVPTGGLGMNTGIGDATDLAWKIAATLDGWGGPGLLASYEAERRPVGLRNTLEAADNYQRSGDLAADAGTVEADGERGVTARARLAAKLPPKIKHFAPIGAHLGYRYEDSPIVVPDGTPPPPAEVATYRPTARPGHRAPHIWLAPGKSTLDLFGRGFTLLVFDDSCDTGALTEAARAMALPLSVHPIANAEAATAYRCRLVLVRPDGHVAWRGDEAPAKPRALLEQVRGAVNQRHVPREPATERQQQGGRLTCD